MQKIQDALTRTPIVYVTRDIDRALGMPLETAGYFVITNDTSDNQKLAEKHPNVILVQSETMLDTWELLERPETAAHIVDKQTNIVVFKNSPKIERICAANGWKLLNPPAGLGNTVEQKISQVTWLGDLTKFFPPFKVKVCRTISNADLPCVVQFNSGHTGTGTLYIEETAAMDETCSLFPERPVRVTEYVNGPMFTLNALVTSDQVLTSTVSYQITGLKPFTQNKFATVGTDWVLPKKILSKEEEATIHDMAKEIGTKMLADGWKGLFGIDVVFDIAARKVYLIEVNARQPGSTTYESTLQVTSPTTFEMHLLALLEEPIDGKITPVLSGAQLFDRRVDPPTIHHFNTGIMSSHEVLSRDIQFDH